MSSEPKRTKQRASRIALDYYKRGDPLLRWKRILAAGLGLAAVAWLAVGFVRRDESRYSPGPLASVHATWELDCAACHVSFSPIRTDAWLAEASTAVDVKCKSCHPEPDHHPKRVIGARSCASCHMEHRGAQASLTKLDDRMCTECHADLKAHANVPIQSQNVSRFDLEHHPQFRPIAVDAGQKPTDPGKLKFSHRRHLALGLTFGPLDRADAKTLDQLPEAYRKEYVPFARADDRGLLQLDCSACHQGDDQPHNAALRGSGPDATLAGAPGAYMRPIVYERHCQACHALTFQPPAESSSEPAIADLVPHRLDAEQIGQFLERAYSTLALHESDALGRPAAQTRDVPGRPLIESEPDLRERIERDVNDASSRLRVTCSKCHELTAAAPFPQVAAAGVPQVWFKHARFNHSAHRFIKHCRDCHQGESLDSNPPVWATQLADGPLAGSSALDHREVLIPGIETCVGCHAPKAELAGIAVGGARFDCVECHGYHPTGKAPAD